MKKLLFTFLAVMRCMVMNATFFDLGSFKYQTTSENTVEVDVILDKNYSGDVVIPSAVTYKSTTYNVTGIGDFAFNDCQGLKSVNIPESVTRIGNAAFRNCTKLTSVAIPKNVTSIGTDAFSCCGVLESITVAEENTVYESPDNCNAIIEKSTHTLLWGCKNTVIPNTVKNIYNSAFYQHTGLTSITIPESVTSIGSAAFWNTGLTSVIIGGSVKTIGNDAFKYRTNMTEIYVLATTPPKLGSNVFYSVPTDIPVYVPDIETYKKTDWGIFTKLIKIDEDLTIPKEEAIADLQTFINGEKIANAPMEEYKSRINAAVMNKQLSSIVEIIKDEINNSKKFTLGEWKYLLKDGAIFDGKLTLTDKDFYQSGNDFTVNGSITYNRTFAFAATGVWQAWFVPFDVPVSNMIAAGMEVAEIAGVLMDENKQPYIAFAKMTNTDDFAKMTDPDAIVKANTPYVVKATTSSVSMTLTGPDIRIRKSTAKELEAQRLTVQSSYNTFTFGGNYQQTNGYENEWYALNTSGIFQKMGENANLAPQRFWMKIDTRTDTPYYTKESDATAKAFIGMTVLGDDETTGITSYENDNENENDNGVIYNLNGQRVTSIQKGQMYIMNGKKFLAK